MNILNTRPVLLVTFYMTSIACVICCTLHLIEIYISELIDALIALVRRNHNETCTLYLTPLVILMISCVIKYKCKLNNISDDATHDVINSFIKLITDKNIDDDREVHRTAEIVALQAKKIWDSIDKSSIVN